MNTDNSRLTSAEITYLWTQYIRETMAVCISKYVLSMVKDSEVRSIFKFSLGLSERHIKKLKEIFNNENFPVPNGFTDTDVNLEAPSLFTDFFWLEYIHLMTTHGLLGYSLSFGASIRRDIRDYYYQNNMESMELYNKSLDVLLSKGIYEPAPYFSMPQKVEYITDLGYVVDLIGKQRSLNSIESGNIYHILKKSMLKKSILLGFSQVAKHKEVRQFMKKGIDVANKHIEVFSSMLQKDNLHSPKSLETQITNSTITPFSDKLMLFHAGFMFSLGILYYGTALATSMRADIVGHCEAAILRSLKVNANWVNILIKNGWIEKPPQASDRKELPNN